MAAPTNEAFHVLGEGSPDPTAFGAKAAGLAWLRQRGYRVPDALFISRFLTGHDELRAALLKTLPPPTQTHQLIARSSALTEDTIDASHAGEYDSVPHI